MKTFLGRKDNFLVPKFVSVKTYWFYREPLAERCYMQVGIDRNRLWVLNEAGESVLSDFEFVGRPVKVEVKSDIRLICLVTVFLGETWLYLVDVPDVIQGDFFPSQGLRDFSLGYFIRYPPMVAANDDGTVTIVFRDKVKQPNGEVIEMCVGLFSFSKKNDKWGLSQGGGYSKNFMEKFFPSPADIAVEQIKAGKEKGIDYIARTAFLADITGKNNEMTKELHLSMIPISEHERDKNPKERNKFYVSIRASKENINYFVCIGNYEGKIEVRHMEDKQTAFFSDTEVICSYELNEFEEAIMCIRNMSLSDASDSFFS